MALCRYGFFLQGYAADEKNWNGHIAQDKTALAAYGKEINRLAEQMDGPV